MAGLEWFAWTSDTGTAYDLPVAVGLCALSLTYLSARRSRSDSPLRRTLMWIGGIALLPSAAFVAVVRFGVAPDNSAAGLAWALAIVVPCGAAMLLRGRDVTWNVAAVAWTVVLALCTQAGGGHIPVYLCCAGGAIGLAWWGTQESRPERINLGIAGFAITVLCFYFSDVMDKIGRSTGLMLTGLLFLGGAWILERTRRRLLAHMNHPEVA